MIVKCRCGAMGNSGTKCHKCSQRIPDVVEEIIVEVPIIEKVCDELECCEECESVPTILPPKRTKSKKDVDNVW